MKEQLSKMMHKSQTLENLATALKNQVDLVRTEGDLRLKEETQKRIDSSKNFQETMEELGRLMEVSTGCNAKLKDENVALAKKMSQLITDCEVSTFFNIVYQYIYSN